MKLFIGVFATTSLFVVSPARAATTCEPTPQGQLCTSQVDFMAFAETAFMHQLQSQWCWAASISMVFSYYQHPISQSRIVSEVYGGLQNLPGAGYVIASKLNGCLVDDAGDSFQSRLVAAYDADAGVYAITNQQIISALDREQPLILGARTHAMVLTGIQYYQTAQGPYVVAAAVFDPWPGVGLRPLQMDELYPIHLGGSLRFLALPNVSDVSGPCPVAPPPPPDPMPGGCSSTTSPSRLVLVVVGLLFALRRRSAARREKRSAPSDAHE